MHERKINRESGPDDFLSFVLEEYLGERRFKAYAELNEMPFDRKALVDFLESEPIAEKLKNQWNRERGPDFPKSRSANMAAKEALLQVLSLERNKALFYLEGDKSYLPDLSEDEVREREKKIMTLIGYFRQALPG